MPVSPTTTLKTLQRQQNLGFGQREDLMWCGLASEVTMEMRVACEGARLYLVALTTIYGSSQHMDKVCFLDKVAPRSYCPIVASEKKKKSQCYCTSVTAHRKWC